MRHPCALDLGHDNPTKDKIYIVFSFFDVFFSNLILKSNFFYISFKKIIYNQLLKTIIKYKIVFYNQLLIINYLSNQLLYRYTKQILNIKE